MLATKETVVEEAKCEKKRKNRRKQARQLQECLPLRELEWKLET